MQVKQKALETVGVDEAGRGSWAGPVFAAAFAALDPKLPKKSWWSELDDSKKLTKANRERLFELLHQAKTAGIADFEIASASAREIDELGIKEANRTAMSRALLALAKRGNIGARTVSVDGNDRYAFPELGEGIPIESIIRGDSKVKAISAASILAKVGRDAHMAHLAVADPRYGYDSHKGYGTKKHADMLKLY